MAAIVNAARFARAPLQAVVRRQYSTAPPPPNHDTLATLFSKHRVAITVGLCCAAGAEATIGYLCFFKKPDAEPEVKPSADTA
ncbi:hypothetical protein BGZ50_003154 [Haplosporangium sp. Z 11]|nr:hypothetical protein BGZ50_003154 [Haplosporangium sp. Z 11]